MRREKRVRRSSKRPTTGTTPAAKHFHLIDSTNGPPHIYKNLDFRGEFEKFFCDAPFDFDKVTW
jgi:hypothetical protein